MTQRLNLSQKLYLPEILRGIWITSRHFFGNLWVLVRHPFGLARDRKGMATYQIPEEPRPLPRRLRARHRIMKREDGTTRCVACMMCETICPARCIYIEAEEHPDPRVEKRPRRFEINTGICVFCGFCVEACPEDAIRMDTYRLDISSSTREGMVLSLEDLSDHDNQDNWTPPPPERPIR